MTVVERPGCEPPQILGDGGENEFILGAIAASKML